MDSSTQADRRARNILVGVAGWSYNDWNGIVYPSPRPRGFHEAAYLANYFDAIEINTSFYGPLKPELASLARSHRQQSAAALHGEALAEVHA